MKSIRRVKENGTQNRQAKGLALVKKFAVGGKGVLLKGNRNGGGDLWWTDAPA